MTDESVGTGGPLVARKALDVQLRATEHALYGDITVPQLHTLLDHWSRDQLGSPISNVRFRAGRIDVVWGVDLVDGRPVVIKTHRGPVDLSAVEAACDAQQRLVSAGFPCAKPLAGPSAFQGQVLTAETLVEGYIPDGRDPANTLLLASGLQQSIAILRGAPDLLTRTGTSPSWCQYHSGPWPVPHDSDVDFSTPVPGLEWVDEFGRRAANQILANRDEGDLVVGHADWYAGNTAFAEGVLVGTYDWELLADSEGVIAGFAAACFAASGTSGGGLSTPEEVSEFMTYYELARGKPLASSERLAAAGAAAWILAFNARWQAALVQQGRTEDGTIALVAARQEDYLNASW